MSVKIRADFWKSKNGRPDRLPGVDFRCDPTEALDRGILSLEYAGIAMASVLDFRAVFRACPSGHVIGSGLV